MAWYEAHQTLAKHPKTLKLSSLIKCERRYAVGLLHDLFCWGLDAAKKDGSLPGLSAEEIAAALDFTGKKGAGVVAALVESGYLETAENGDFRIHDWYDYAGKLMDKREADRRRKSKLEAPETPETSSGISTDFQRISSGIPIATVPNLTVPKDNNNIIHSCMGAEEKKSDEEDAAAKALKTAVRMLLSFRRVGLDEGAAYRYAAPYGITPEQLDAAAEGSGS